MFVRTGWLFAISDVLYPSVYLRENGLSLQQEVQLIQGRVNESKRIAKNNGKHQKIIPYYRYKYTDTTNYIEKYNLKNHMVPLKTSNIDGFIIWGSSKDLNSKAKCLEFFEYVDNILGPTVSRN